jgi:uncharacterized OB-fold protein
VTKQTEQKQILVARAHWREDGERMRLIASTCTKCGRQYLPSVEVCTECGERTFRAEPVTDPGTLYAFTVNHVPQAGYPVPYAVAFVDFPSGLRVFGQLSLEGAPPALGEQVGVESAVLYERADVRATGFRFRTIANEEAQR